MSKKLPFFKRAVFWSMLAYALDRKPDTVPGLCMEWAQSDPEYVWGKAVKAARHLFYGHHWDAAERLWDALPEKSWFSGLATQCNCPEAFHRKIIEYRSRSEKEQGEENPERRALRSVIYYKKNDDESRDSWRVIEAVEAVHEGNKVALGLLIEELAVGALEEAREKGLDIKDTSDCAALRSGLESLAEFPSEYVKKGSWRCSQLDEESMEMMKNALESLEMGRMPKKGVSTKVSGSVETVNDQEYRPASSERAESEAASRQAIESMRGQASSARGELESLGGFEKQSVASSRGQRTSRQDFERSSRLSGKIVDATVAKGAAMTGRKNNGAS